MPSKGCMWLSDYKDEPIFVMCETCEILKKMDFDDLMTRHGDLPMPTIVDWIAKEIIGCDGERSGLYNRCRLHKYYNPAAPSSIRNEKVSVKLEDLCSWEVVVAKCRYCGHVSNIERWQVGKILKPGMTLDDLKKQLRCRKCSRKGDVECTIAKLPR